jgi:nucleoside-diphosphate-sugar epimerase
MNKNILITGGAGFVGSNLGKRLYSLGCSVVSIDNYSTGSENNHTEGIEYIKNDIISTIDYHRYGKFDAIVHCAAKARIKQSFIDDKEYFHTNILGTYNITKYAAQNSIPIVYIGTSSHHSGKFSNPYTFTKDVGEDIIRLYQQNFSLLASIARLYNVYGPNELMDDNGTLIGKWKYNYKNNLPFIIYGDGSKRRDFTHVDDVCDAIIKIIINLKYGFEFELGRGENYSVSEVVDMFQYNNIIYKPDLVGEAPTTLAENNETKTILNWNPKNNLSVYIKSIK